MAVDDVMLDAMVTQHETSTQTFWMIFLRFGKSADCFCWWSCAIFEAQVEDLEFALRIASEAAAEDSSFAIREVGVKWCQRWRSECFQPVNRLDNVNMT